MSAGELRGALEALAAEIPVETVIWVGDVLTDINDRFGSLVATTGSDEMQQVRGQLVNRAGDAIDTAMETLGNVRADIQRYAAGL